MAINETSVDGKKYRQKTTDGWKWYSFITKAKDILFGDGEDANNNLETNLGSFKGITTSTNVTETGYAADATVVSDLNRSLGGMSFYEDEDGNKYVVGADSVPKKLGSGSILPFFMRLNHNNNATFGWCYLGVMVNGKIYQTDAGSYNNKFPSTLTSGTFDIDGHSVYVVGSNLVATKGQGYLPQNVTLSLYVDGSLFGTYTGIGMGSDYTYALAGAARIYFPSTYLIEL